MLFKDLVSGKKFVFQPSKGMETSTVLIKLLYPVDQGEVIWTSLYLDTGAFAAIPDDQKIIQVSF